MDRHRRVRELVVQLADLVDQQLQTLDLHRRARKAVEDDAVSIGLVEQLPQQDGQHFFVADHAALRLDPLHLRRRQQIADHDRRTGESARVADELRLRALARARRAAEQDDLLREAKVLAADLLLERLPRRREDDAGVFDFEVEDLRPRAIGGGRGHRTQSIGRLAAILKRGPGAEPLTPSYVGPGDLYRCWARYFAVVCLAAASMSAWVSMPEQLSDRMRSNGASTSVCFGAVHGPVSTSGSSTVASISSVFASTRR